MAGHRGRHPGDGIPSSRTEAPYMIISIDFGTTFSGVCWTWSQELDTVRTIKGWDEDIGGSSSDKVPSKLQYTTDEGPTWGYAAEDGASTFTWFKLMLDYEELPLNIKNSVRVREIYNKLANGCPRSEDPDYRDQAAIQAAMQVTRDYLELLWNHALTVILNGYSQSWALGMHCKVNITKPAIWSQKASARTLKVAEDAILPNAQDFESVNVSLVSEPEAAAYAVLQAPSVTKRPDLTHDAISYEVESVAPMRLKECVAGTGDLCGAVFLDDEFERFLQTELGRREWDLLDPDVRRRVLARQWEHNIKRNFDPTKASKLWAVDIPGMDSLSFTRGEIETIFQPTCSRARALIRRQVDQIQAKYNKTPKAIILVGGLGSSRYLSHVLRMEYANRIEIRHSAGNDTWIAVCRGAVLAMKEEMVISRVARQHYGMCLEVPYDYSTEQRFLGLDRLIFEPAEGHRAFVTGGMEWIVRRGARIRQLRPSSYTGIRYLRFPEELADGKIDFDIWVCAEQEAPAWITPSVKPLCTIRVHLSAGFEDLPSCTSPGNETFRMVKVSMTMVPDGNTIDFVVRFEGQRLDKEICWPEREYPTRHIALEEDVSAY